MSRQIGEKLDENVACESFVLPRERCERTKFGMDATCGESSTVGTYTCYLLHHDSDTIVFCDGEFADHGYTFPQGGKVFPFRPQRIFANGLGDGTTTC